MTWTEIVPLIVGQRQRISSIFYPSLASSQTLYIGLATGDPSLDGIPKTTNGGASWRYTNFPRTFKVNALGGPLNNADTFYAAFANGDVIKTTNGGEDPTTITTLQGQRAGYPMATLAIPPNQPNDNTVYVGTVCQGGVYKGVYSGSPLSWTWTAQKKPIPGDFHSHFHYVMRLARDPIDAGKIYVTEDNFVFKTTNGGDPWTRTSPTVCDPLDPQYPQPTCVHLHGLTVAPSPRNNTLYVGSGHGKWPGGTDSPGRIWRSDDSGNINSWVEITHDFPPPPPGTCVEGQFGTKTGCYSAYSIAVSPNALPQNRPNVFVGTFGHENYAGDTQQGAGIGVVRGIDGGENWQLLTDGLCANGATALSSGSQCQGSPDAGVQSLFVGTVAIDNTPTNANVYIATLNGIYTMPENGNSWVDISPNFSAPPGTCGSFDDCRRFESIAVSPSSNFLLAGTSQPLFDGDRPARIFKSTDRGITWTVWTMTNPPNPSRAWADQFRVRDIQMRTSKAYAVIEGSGIYRLDLLLQTQRPR